MIHIGMGHDPEGSRVQLEIPDSRGVLKLYAVVVHQEEGVWCYDLELREEDKEYYVTRNREGLWGCTCPAFKFGKTSPESMRVECKHVKHLMELHEILTTTWACARL